MSQLETRQVADAARSRADLAHRYHQPADRNDPAWGVSGSLEDLALRQAVGRRFANDRRGPAWYPSSEFRAVREASRRPGSR